MQRVIDVSEEDFEIISMRMKNYNRAIDDEVRIMANAIVNGTPLNDVLDKIRAEIIQERESNTYGEYDKIFELCLLIIDKYRKGEDE